MEQNSVEENRTDEQARRSRRAGGGRFFAGGLLAGAALTLAVGGLVLAEQQLGWFGLAQGVPGASFDESASAINSDSVYKLQLLEESIDEYYYKSDELTAEQKEDGMYKGLLASLGDPYSVYYNEEEVKDLSAQTQGVYYGIGASIGIDEKTQAPVIDRVVPGTPAEAAGLRTGDVIYKVDGQEGLGLSIEEVVALIKGEEGTTVHLTIYREGEDDYLEMDIERAQVDAQTVSSEMLDDGIGYLQIAEFDKVTVDQFAEALMNLKEQGMRGLILDLRSNPGGDADVVTEIAGHILPEGLVFYVVDKNGGRTDYRCEGKDPLEVPLVVLVNEDSASASEILAGAIQDAGIGTVVGMQTYGKGVVQTIYSLTDGTALKLTVAGYFTRGGRDINEKGITPDVECPFDAERYYEDGTDNQLEKGIEVLEEKMAQS